MEKSVQNTQESVLRKHSGELAQGALSHRSVVSPFPSGIQVQAKLETAEVDDPLEKEADSMADLAMRKIETGSAGALPPPSASPRSSVSAFGGSSVMLPSRMESQLNASLGSGYALPGLLRSQMEGAFGQPFSQVRVHTDASSAEMNQGIGARAFTYGNDIFFNQGQYNPSSADGQKLIAHELTHVAQQSGKVARNVNHSEQQKIVEYFLVQNWHWGQFFTYLQLSHGDVLTELGLSLDDGFFGTNWEEDRGVPFLEKVSWAIARDIKKTRNLKDWDSAYVAAIQEFKKHRNRQKRALAPVFDALVTITENHRAYKNEAGTRSSYNELNAKNKSLPFSGTFFDNRDNIIGNLFFFLQKEYPDALSYDYILFLSKTTTKSIDDASDISHNSKAFARQIERHLSEFIQKRYDAYYHKKFPDRPEGDSRKAKDTYTLAEFYNAFEEELEHHISTYGKSARMLLDMVINRHTTVHSNEFYLPPDFISADAWTDLFFTIMLQGGSLFLGGPLVSGIVAKVVLKSPAAKWLINQAVQVAFDAVTGAGEEVLRQKMHGEEFAPKAVLQAAGISVVMGRIVDGGMGTVKGVGEMVGRNRAVKQAITETVGDVGEGVARGAKDAVPSQRALPSPEADSGKLELGKPELEPVPVNRGQSTSPEMQTAPSASPAHESTVSVPEASATEVSLPTIPDKKDPAREMHDTVTSAPPVQKGPMVNTPSQGSPVVYNYPAVPDPRVYGYPAIPDPRVYGYSAIRDPRVYGYPAISSTAPEPVVTPVKVQKRRSSKSRKAKKVEAHDTHDAVVSQTPIPEKNVSTIETQRTEVSQTAVTERDLSPIDTEPTSVSQPSVTEVDVAPVVEDTDPWHPAVT